jgi:hypothetical protein
VKTWEANMGTLGKLVCLGFGAFYVLGVLLYVLAPTLREHFRPRWSKQR